MSLSRTVSEIDGDLSRKSQKFPTHPSYFASRVKGSSCNWVSALGGGVKKLEPCGYRAEKKFDDIFSRLDTINQRDGQTDGHRATAKTALTHSVER